MLYENFVRVVQFALQNLETGVGRVIQESEGATYSQVCNVGSKSSELSHCSNLSIGSERSSSFIRILPLREAYHTKLWGQVGALGLEPE